MGGEDQKPNTKGTDPMKRSYRILTGKATSKSVAEQAAVRGRGETEPGVKLA
jgi:hypothetical protein